MSPKKTTPQDETIRDARPRSPAPQPQRYPSDVGRWALVVGISRYQHEPWNLEFAHRDADELYRLLQTRTGGGYDPERIVRLVDEEATTGNITRALRSFLKKPAREDLALLFFACHGTPDPDRPENVYLLTHDTDPQDIAGTALPMREVNLALQETLLSERVVLLADTCHSAAIGGRGGRSVADRAAEVNRYLQGLSETRPGVALLTSAEASEVSREDARWGGGHGVFSYYLLKGMQGEADGYGQPRDGQVNAGELFDYVRDKVRDATGHKQHPAVGHAFDRNLPLAITGGIAAREHNELGFALLKLGAMLDDGGRYRSAVRHFDTALRLTIDPLPEAHLGRGRALLALGEYEAAAEALLRAAGGRLDLPPPGDDPTLAEAHFYLGLAYAKQGLKAEAAQALDTYLRQWPEGQRPPWIVKLLEWRALPGTGEKRALLIGIGAYDQRKGTYPLKGPPNDIKTMQTLLLEQIGFKAENITMLQDADATREGILAALDALRRQAGPADVVLIHYSGHAQQGDEPGYLAPYDTVSGPEGITNTIDAEELDARVRAIAASSKILILDTHATNRMVELSTNQNDYTLLLATTPDRQAYERRVEVDGEQVTLGAFTYSLVSQIRQQGAAATAAEIMHGAVAEIQHLKMAQSPVLAGPKHQPLFLIRSEEAYLSFFDLADRENYEALTVEEVEQRYTQALEQLTVPFPRLHYSLGRAFLEKEAYRRALQALQTACEQEKELGGTEHSGALLALAIAQIRTQHYAKALKSFRRYLELEPENAEALHDTLEMVEQLQHGRKHALLVGIDDYGPVGTPEDRPSQQPPTAVRGAVNDVRALERVLVHRYGFQQEDIKVLLNGEASSQAIGEALGQIVNQASKAPALFYFSGAGSADTRSWPVLMVANPGGGAQAIPLPGSSGQAGWLPNNLVAIMDAGWAAGVEMPYGQAWGSRFVPLAPALSRDLQPIAETKPVPTWVPDEVWMRRREEVQRALQRFTLGQVSIYQISIQALLSSLRDPKGTGLAEAEFEPPGGDTAAAGAERVVHGVLSHALITTLWESDPDTLTYQGLADGIAQKLKWLQPYVVGGDLDATIFSNPLKEAKVHREVEGSIWRRPIHQAIELLEGMVDRGDGQDPGLHLDLGVAHAALGDYRRSVEALETAVQQHGEGEYPEARYHLGRVLLESGQDVDRAVSELRQATASAPELAAAYYHLGQAIRARVRNEAKALGEAAEALQTYLRQGAPLGQREEVAQFLQRRSEGSLGLPGDDYDTE